MICIHSSQALGIVNKLKVLWWGSVVVPMIGFLVKWSRAKARSLEVLKSPQQPHLYDLECFCFFLLFSLFNSKKPSKL